MWYETKDGTISRFLSARVCVGVCLWLWLFLCGRCLAADSRGSIRGSPPWNITYLNFTISLSLLPAHTGLTSWMPLLHKQAHLWIHNTVTTSRSSHNSKDLVLPMVQFYIKLTKCKYNPGKNNGIALQETQYPCRMFTCLLCKHTQHNKSRFLLM